MAVLLQFAIFAVFACVGFGVLALLGGRRIRLREALLAPAFGAALLTIVATILNHAGSPIRTFAAPLVAACVVGSAIVFFVRRPQIPWRPLAPFVLLLGLALGLSARPSIEYGFNWLSYVNEDMINYASTAQRLVDYPFYALPPQASIDDSRQLNAESFWFHDVIGGERVGVEALLALVITLTKLTGFQAFMSLCIAGYYMLIWATGALATARGHRPWLALGSAAALVLSSLTTLGLLYQLLGQMFGLAALVAAIALLGDAPGPAQRKTIVRRWLLFVLTLAFVVAAYPELFPFAAVGIAILLVIRIARQPRLLLAPGTFLDVAAPIVAFLLLSNYGLTMAYLIALRAHSATLARQEILFPYFLLPSGLGNLWGIVPLAYYPSDPWMSLGIAFGALLLCVVTVVSVFASRRLHPSALIVVIMVVLGVAFFARRDDFALFKLAMYVQPFLFAGMAVGLAEVLRPLRFRPRQAIAAGAVVAIGAFGLYGQQLYVAISRAAPDLADYKFSEIPGVSNEQLLNVLHNAVNNARGGMVATDASSAVWGKIESAYFRPDQFAFLSDDFLKRFRVKQPVFGAPNPRLIRHEANAQVAEFSAREPLAPFALPGIAREGPNSVTVPWIPPRPRDPHWLLALGADGSILNRSTDAAPGSLVTLVPWSKVRNHLTLVQATHAGRQGWIVPNHDATFFRPEQDFAYPGETLEGIGRDLFFEVTNPKPPLRLIVWGTSSVKEDGKKRIPRPKVFGATAAALGGVGRGSARLLSAPFKPRIIDGRAYFGLDFGEDGKVFQKPFTGLMRLYGNDLLIDSRRLVVFGRDISLISDSDYRRWDVPSWTVDVPAMLKDPHMIFSGIYEGNGWCSEDVALTLQSDANTNRFRIDGSVPQLPGVKRFTTRLRVSIDGRFVTASTLDIGPFDIEAPVKLLPGKHEVRLAFSAAQRFPAPDNRLVSARLDSIGFPP